MSNFRSRGSFYIKDIKEFTISCINHTSYAFFVIFVL